MPTPPRLALPALFVAVLVVAAVPGPVAGQAPTDPSTDGASVVVAHPLRSTVDLDGQLDEAVWAAAESVTGFRQYEPSEGAPASQRTEVRVLYGPKSLLVGARLFDDRPEAIEAALGRRDDYNRADWFVVSLDSYLDRRTAYVFAVNAAGVQGDGIRAGGEMFGPPGVEGVDESWDAIWYSAVRVTDEGWTVELEIPYSMLRFTEAPEQRWGVHFARRIPRLGELAEWPLVPRAERANFVAGHGLLTGIQGIAPRRNVQVQPYAVSQLRTFEDAAAPGERTLDESMDVGGDLRVSLGPNASLDATINPDFGQVESDPAVLNLTAFETFFDERRPFFIEGSQIFSFAVGPGRLLYTRRIGAEAPIIGAAKVSGQTERGLSFGVLAAATGDRFQPGRGYGVVRASQQLGRFSSVGGIATGFDADAGGPGPARRAFTGGADWDLRFAGNRYGVEGFAALTHRAVADADAETGFASKVWLRRRQGAWKGFAGVDVFSDRFDPNDLGQLRERNFVAVLTSIDHDVLGGAPFGPFQRAQLGLFSVNQFAYDSGLFLGQNADFSSEWTLRGFQEIELGVEVRNPFGGYDPYETRGLGPWARPAQVGVAGEVSTDRRRTWFVEPGLGVAFTADGGRGIEAEVGAEWIVSDRVALSAGVEGEWEDGATAWAANETFLRSAAGWAVGRHAGPPMTGGPEAFVALGPVPALDAYAAGAVPFAPGLYHAAVFGTRDTRSLDATLRSTVTFRPSLSLQVYGQLFLARGRYGDFTLLHDRDTLVPLDVYPKRDEFAFSSLQSNVVLRWEYRPGSAMYVVWTHGQRAEHALNPLAPWGDSPYETPLGDQFRRTFDVVPDDVLLVKVSYTFLR